MTTLQIMYRAKIERWDRKTISISVDGEGHVLAMIPWDCSLTQLQTVVEQNRARLERAILEAEAEHRSPPAPPPRSSPPPRPSPPPPKPTAPKTKRAATPAVFTEAELKELMDRARKIFPERVRQYAPKVGVTWGRITIRHQSSRWGSCSSKGNLNFNCLLVLAPLETLDSVVVHELCHRKQMNHSKKFYAEVYRVMPEYDRVQQWLKTEGASLIRRLPNYKKNKK